MKDLNKTFVVYGDSAIQMFAWLEPYIEKAGYKHTTSAEFDSMGNILIGARRITIEKYESNG
jgi:hypothetical protein